MAACLSKAIKKKPALPLKTKIKYLYQYFIKREGDILRGWYLAALDR